MNKKIRKLVHDKCGGLCAYCGKPLGDDWQVDHVTSKISHYLRTYNNGGTLEQIKENLKKVDDIDNLLPAIKIINHYKRSLCLESFRKRIKTLHLRLAKLPKKTGVEKTKRRKEYLFKVAALFDITIDKPFDGKFYFEK